MVQDQSIALGVRVAVLVAFEKLLRASEYCSEKASSPSATLLAEHVRWNASYGGYDVLLAGAKTDKYNQGQVQRIMRRDDPFCVVRALSHYIEAEGDNIKQGAPFFIKHVGDRVSYVTADDINRALKRHAADVGIPVDRASTHSLRVGGAFALAAAGLPWEEITMAGRWSMDQGNVMAMLYARMSVGRIMKATKAMSLLDPSDDDVPTDCLTNFW